MSGLLVSSFGAYLLVFFFGLFFCVLSIGVRSGVPDWDMFVPDSCFVLFCFVFFLFDIIIAILRDDIV